MIKIMLIIIQYNYICKRFEKDTFHRAYILNVFSDI